MNRALPFLILMVLMIADACISFTVGDDGGDRATSSSVVVDPEIWERLETEPSVKVYIGLRVIGVPIEDTTLDQFRSHAQEVQASVLAALGPGDFELTYRHEFFGLSGRVTESGLRILAEHEGVRSVEIPVPGEYAIGPSSRFQAGE